MALHHKLLSAAALLAALALSTATVALAQKQKPRKKKPSEVAVTISVDASLVATVEIKNVSKRTLTLASHVATHEMHYDWLAVHLSYPVAGQNGCGAGDATSDWRTLTFVDDRDKSAPIFVDVAPGKSITHRIDLDAWAKRRVNGATPLASGYYNVRVDYDTRRESGAWSGYAGSSPFQLTVPGTITTMCKTNPGWTEF